MTYIKNLKHILLALPAISIGAFVAQSSGVSQLAYLPNIAALFIGSVFSFLIKTKPSFFREKAFALSLIGLFIIFLSLFSTGLESVHRWVAIGPISLNVSEVLTPIILYGVCCSHGVQSLILSLCTSILYILQPDAGQATAFCLGVIIIFLFNNHFKRLVRLSGIVLAITLTAYTWPIPDPLLPVEHVERILHLAYMQSGLVFTLALVSILLLHVPLIKVLRNGPTSSVSLLALSFSIYFLMTFIVTELGNFPVPVIGAGAAPILGWTIMTGLLATE